MLIVADMHVHLYDCYDLATAFKSALQNLGQHATNRNDSLKVIFLAERSDCNVFQDLMSESRPLPDGFTLEQTNDADSFWIIHGNEKLLVIAGRQINTKERIEVLALGQDLPIADGLPIEITVAEASATKALCVLPWGLGKWLGKRGQIVKKVIHARPSIRLADSSLRPPFWLRSPLFRLSKLPILAGTDPLPKANEEYIIGSYGICFESDINLDKPVSSLIHAIHLKSTHFRIVGKRTGLFSFFQRVC